MYDTSIPNVPILGDEGLKKIMELYISIYKQGRYLLPSQSYVANLVQLSTDYNPTVNNYEEYISNKDKYCVQIVFCLLEAIKEDIDNYGFEEYINKIRIQSNSGEILKYLNSTELYYALNYPKDMIKKNIEMKNYSDLPPLIQYLYKINYLNGEHLGDKDELPYVVNKELNDPEKTGQGRKCFRLYLNNPIGESGLYFYLLFVQKLIEQRIPYNNKFNYHCEEERKDKSIFYFPTDYLGDVTKILDDIYIENPQLIGQFGTPSTCCAQSSYYGIAHTGASLRIKNRTYNMFFNDVTSIAFFIYFCKQLLMHGAVFSKLTEDEKNIVRKYAQGVRNMELFNEIISPAYLSSEIHNFEVRKKQEIVVKYSSLFNICLQTNDYRNILMQVVSVRMYGDLEHTDYPISFNESFYDISLSSAKKM